MRKYLLKNKVPVYPDATGFHLGLFNIFNGCPKYSNLRCDFLRRALRFSTLAKPSTAAINVVELITIPLGPRSRLRNQNLDTGSELNKHLRLGTDCILFLKL